MLSSFFRLNTFCKQKVFGATLFGLPNKVVKEYFDVRGGSIEIRAENRSKLKSVLLIQKRIKICWVYEFPEDHYCD